MYTISLNLRLIYSVLPPTVANELRHGRPVGARKYECVTLLFSGIVGFSELTARNSDPSGVMKIVSMLNSLYTAFDVLTDSRKNPNIYKVTASFFLDESIAYPAIRYP